MRVELGGGIYAEECADGRIKIEAVKAPAEAILTRAALARALTVACNECIDQGDG